MKLIPLGKSGLSVPSVAVGCMRLVDVGEKEAEALLDAALELGCNFFDHADIYGQGACESRFAQAVR
ncbi:MAG TPA: aldo/keto reductase, partial [Candidatus Eisenbergiella stercorigallinarum]|nr:aldo/keto reductase [Candidatus Eisenbergiella stercorigallinarum]